MNKKISIIIATWNASQTLKKCLDSIVPQLAEECELIVIDGGSKDSTNDIVKSYGDKVAVHISEKDKGIYDAWNKGVNLAHGEWVAFIGADDVLIPGAIDKYLQAIKSTANASELDYICAYNEHIDENGTVLKVIGGEPKWSIYRKGMNAAHVASLHNKKNLFETIGGYDLQFKICADYDLLLRKRDKLKYLFIDAHIARMKIGGMSFSVKAIKETYRIRRKNKSLPIIINELMFIRDVLAFKFFIFRKKMMGGKF